MEVIRAALALILALALPAIAAAQGGASYVYFGIMPGTNGPTVRFGNLDLAGNDIYGVTILRPNTSGNFRIEASDGSDLFNYNDTTGNIIISPKDDGDSVFLRNVEGGTSYAGLTSTVMAVDPGNLDLGTANNAAGVELTISGGVITKTGILHNVDTESNDATDDLDTVNPCTASENGQILILQANNGARTVVAKDGTGNLALAGDFSMDSGSDKVMLVCNSANWIELSRSDNAP